MRCAVSLKCQKCATRPRPLCARLRYRRFNAQSLANANMRRAFQHNREGGGTILTTPGVLVAKCPPFKLIHGDYGRNDHADNREVLRPAELPWLFILHPAHALLPAFGSCAAIHREQWSSHGLPCLAWSLRDDSVSLTTSQSELLPADRAIEIAQNGSMF